VDTNIVTLRELIYLIAETVRLFIGDSLRFSHMTIRRCAGLRILK